MNDRTNDSSYDAEQALNAAWDFLKNAEHDIQRGETVDLAPVEALISQLCQRVSELPHDAAQAYRPELERLLTSLTSLQGGLKGQHEAIKQKLGQLNLQKQAAKAYVTSGHLAGKKPDDGGEA